MFLKISLIIAMIILTANPSLSAQEASYNPDEYQLFYQIEDQKEDDHGPGSYRYPQQTVFQPGDEHFDLINFSIRESEQNYLFLLQFGRVDDPWIGLYGFSHQLIHFYFDTESTTGQEELFRDGANVNLNPEFPWDLHIQLSGWWIRAMNPGDDPDEPVGDILNWDFQGTTWDLNSAEVWVEEDVIYFQVPKEEIGDISDSNLYLLVGGFDPFGEDFFRPVKDYPTRWSFYHDYSLKETYSPEDFQEELASRVIDYLYPEAGVQEEVLPVRRRDQTYLDPVKLPPRVQEDTMERLDLIVALGYLLSSTAVILYLIYVITRSALDE
ncbi:MAG: glucodextranase DOMON-like domain-containing protein [Bacillota bacterium]